MPSIPHRHYQASRSARSRYSSNPYFRSRSADRLGRSRIKSLLGRISPRMWFYFFLACVIIGALLWLFAFSNIFAIEKISVEGTVNYDSSEIEQEARAQIEHPRALVFSQSRLAIFNGRALQKTLEEKYSLRQLRVIKKLPKTLIIRVVETEAAAVWFEADQYYLISLDGVVLRPTEGPAADLPTLYNNGLPRMQDGKINAQEKAIAAARSLRDELQGRFSYFPYEQLVVDNDRDTIKIIGKKRPAIYLTTDEALPAELDRLDVLLKGELASKLPKLQYIDLRFGDKVYYK